MKAKLDGVSSPSAILEPFDPMRTKARLLYHYRGLTWHALKEMDYREYFGFVRELSIILQEQQGTMDKNKGKRNNSDAMAFMREFPTPEPYEGETIRLI